MNATVLTSDTLYESEIIRENWQISDLSIDSLVIEFKYDYRVHYLEADRLLKFHDLKVTSLENEDHKSKDFILRY